MRKNSFLFMIILVIVIFTGALKINATMQVSPVVSDSLRAEYSDDYFLTSAVNKSNNLAQLSIVASDAAYKNTTVFLKSCGFSDIVDKKVIKNQQTLMLHPIKVTMGHKIISMSEKKYDLYAILIRGTTEAMEWVSNFDLSSLDKECANQFMIPKNNIRILFDSYKKKYFTSGATTKIWVVGHSRGGAVANLLAHELSSKYSGSNVYAYTFASAKTITQKNEDANIFNYIIQEDVVPKVPSGYVRYGTDIILSTKGHMGKLYQQMTSKKYEGTVTQAHSLEAYMCAFLNTITFPDDELRISMNITSKDLYPGERVLLKATVSGISSKVKWKSSDKKIATVSSSGSVTAKKTGTCIITAIADGKEATCKVTVKNSLTASAAYKKLIQRYEKKYGEAEFRYMSGKPYWTGLCFAKLLDFNNDNIDELILAYQTEISDIKKVQYYIELWTFDGKLAKKITSGISWYGNNIPFFGEFSIAKYKGKYLLELTDKGGLLDCYYGTESSGKLGLLHKFLWKGDIIYGSWYRNGTKISQKKFEHYQNMYNVNKTKYVFWKLEYSQIIRNEIEKTKKTLKM